MHTIKKGIVVYTNKELLRIFKVEENNVIGIDIKNKNEITKKVSEEFYNNLINPKNDNYLELNSIKYKTTVEKFEINKNDNLTCIVFSDITQELNFQKKLEDLAVKDSLTGLGNRRYKLDMDINKFNKQKLKNISVVVIDFR